MISSVDFMIILEGAPFNFNLIQTEVDINSNLLRAQKEELISHLNRVQQAVDQVGIKKLPIQQLKQGTLINYIK